MVQYNLTLHKTSTASFEKILTAVCLPELDHEANYVVPFQWSLDIISIQFIAIFVVFICENNS